MPKLVFLLAIFAAIDVGPSCGGRRHHGPPIPPAPPTAARPTPTLPTGPTGAVVGTVRFDGKAPEQPEQKRGVDPVCAKTPMKEEEIVLDDAGHLKNVFVRVLGAPATPPPADKVTVRQTQCRYLPRVVGVVVGQKLSVNNGDPTFHNVHGRVGTTEEFNTPQVPSAPDLERTFAEPGTLHTLRCDVHQWMTGYVWTVENSYFAITGDDGTFKIPAIPVGKYQLEAWHERFGRKTAELSVTEAQPATVNFQYTATDNTTPR